MTRVPFLLSTMALAILAACSSQPQRSAPAPATAPVTAAPAPAAAAAPTPAYVVAPAGTVIVQATPAPVAAALRAGFGRIESIQVVPSAAAGATAPSATRRIGIRMEDSTLQHFDTQAQGVAVGDRIEILANGTMRYPG